MSFTVTEEKRRCQENTASSTEITQGQPRTDFLAMGIELPWQEVKVSVGLQAWPMSKAETQW